MTDARPWPEAVEARLGPLTLPAPDLEPRQFEAAHGHLWQWVGAGEPLLSLSAGVRRTQIGDARGVDGHLDWEVDQAVALLDPETATPAELEVRVVPGARAAASAVLGGRRDGMHVRTGLLVTTDGSYMHVVRVVADAGHVQGPGIVQRVLDDVRVHRWEPPR